MKMYYDWGKFDEGGVLRYCPRVIGNIANPNEETRRANGYLPIVRDDMPEDREGGYWEETEPKLDGDRITVGWRWVEDEPVTPTVEDYDRAMEAHIKAERVARGYTTREPSAYINSPNARFAQDAADWGVFLAKTMQYGLGVLNAYAEGLSVPSLDEFKTLLPKCEWTFDKEA